MLAAASAMVAGSIPAAAEEDFAPLRLQPSSKWVLNYSEEYCALSRAFGEGEERVRIWLTNFGPRVSYRVLVVGAPVAKSNGPTDVFDVRMGQETEFREVYGIMGEADGEPSAEFSLTYLPKERYDEMSLLDDADSPIVWPIDPDFEAASDTLQFDFGRKELELETGSMKPPLDAMRSCRDDLLESWGLDPEAIRGLTRHPQIARKDLRRIMRSYPKAMSASGRSGVVPIRVMVNADGSVESCTVQLPSMEPDFNETVCEQIGSDFEPARGADGQPIKAPYHTQVIFTMSGF